MLRPAFVTLKMLWKACLPLTTWLPTPDPGFDFSLPLFGYRSRLHGT